MVEAQLLNAQHDAENAEEHVDLLEERVEEGKDKARAWKRRAIRYKGERNKFFADLTEVKKQLEVSNIKP